MKRSDIVPGARVVVKEHRDYYCPWYRISSDKSYSDEVDHWFGKIDGEKVYAKQQGTGPSPIVPIGEKIEITSLPFKCYGGTTTYVKCKLPGILGEDVEVFVMYMGIKTCSELI